VFDWLQPQGYTSLRDCQPVVSIVSPDGITLFLITKELQGQLLQGRVDRVHQPEQLEIDLIIRKPGQNFRLLLSAHAENARLHLTSCDKKNPIAPPTFCLVLRKYLEGSRLVRIEQQGLDRVVHLVFSRLGESGGYQEVVLISEIMGKHSNLILVDRETGQIIDGIKRYSHAVSRYREVLPGRMYIAPPAQAKVAPLELDEERFISILQDNGWDKTLEDLVFRRLSGIGPELARELLSRANLPPELRLEECGAYELGSLWQALQKTVLPLLRGQSEPTLVLDGKKIVCYAPWRPTQYPDLSLIASPNLNTAADTFYTGHTENGRFRQLQNALLSVVRQESTRVGKKLSLQQQSQIDAGQSEEFRIRGEMLFAHLHLLTRGQTRALVPNLYDQEAPPLEIDLNPSLTPSQNAQVWFRRYEKARHTLKTNKIQMEQTLDEQRYLSSIRTALDLAEAVDELSEIRAELEQVGYLKVKSRRRTAGGRQTGPGHRDKKPSKSLLQIAKITSPDGYEILFGKNNRQNDYLTMHLARKEDLWLHVKEAPGAHVIIRSQPGREIPDTTLEQAAQLAAYYSDSRHSSKVAVDCTPRKNVWKPAAARPGFVLYENYRTLLAVPATPVQD
jgi:predicted ribosome quality control (RQC) complex YloA/Tae2 family protein